MDAIGALARISHTLKISTYNFRTFLLCGSCLALNITASNQYLQFLPGKMAKAYKRKGLAQENLVRHLKMPDSDFCINPYDTCG
jgi:Na+/H+ antiporter NhaC